MDPKTMEDVWNDITLASLDDHTFSREPFSVNSNIHSSNPHFPFQDFHATRPLSNDPPTNRVSTHGDNNLLYGSFVPPPATLLNINFPFEAFASSSSLASFGKKRNQQSENTDGDRRYKRMMKNRESAARSRARKQAYSNGLEDKFALLKQENKKLREKLQQLPVAAAAAAQVTKKRTLQRTSTAPF